MSYILAAVFAIAAISGVFGGAELSSAFSEGPRSAVELCLSIGGAVCFWSGVMELMERCGVSAALSKLLSPLLRRLYPRSFHNGECASAIAENFSANLLGLGSAATPAGLRAARLMNSPDGGGERELRRFVVMNTASVQLFPTTVAAIRAGLGAENAFDILPCVWVSSIASVCVGLLTLKLLEGRERS